MHYLTLSSSPSSDFGLLSSVFRLPALPFLPAVLSSAAPLFSPLRQPADGPGEAFTPRTPHPGLLPALVRLLTDRDAARNEKAKFLLFIQVFQ